MCPTFTFDTNGNTRTRYFWETAWQAVVSCVLIVLIQAVTKMERLRPSEIRFAQDSINNVFDKKSDHRNVMIGETLDKLCERKITVDSIPRITVYMRNGKYFSADNRRLWVFQQYERLGGCRDIPVISHQYWGIPTIKFTTYNEGISTRVRGRPGGSWYSKRDNALGLINDNPIPQADSSLRTSYETTTPHNNRVDLMSNSSNSRIAPTAIPFQSRIHETTNPFQSRIAQTSRFQNKTPVTGGIEVNNNVYGSLLRSQTAGSNRNEQICHTRYDDIVASVRGLQMRQRASHTYLDPKNIKYTKKSIPSTFSGVYTGVSLRSVARELLTSPTGEQTNIPPIIVYRVFEDDRVVDGNRRLWAYRLARQHRSSIRIPAVIKTDVEEYKVKIRENNSKVTLSLRDIILFDGEDIEIVDE